MNAELPLLSKRAVEHQNADVSGQQQIADLVGGGDVPKPDGAADGLAQRSPGKPSSALSTTSSTMSLAKLNLDAPLASRSSPATCTVEIPRLFNPEH